MKTYISILRGINVSGQKMIKMESLRELYSGMGFQRIQTYIQSGNVVFQTDDADVDVDSLQVNIQNNISEIFGFDVPVMVFEFDHFKDMLIQNPFLNDSEKEVNHLHVTFLSAIPETERVAKMDELEYQNDRYQLIDKAVFLYCPNNYGNTKLSNNFLETKLKVKATTRNWKTSQELIRIAEAISLMED